MIRGNVKVTKIYSNGDKELIFDDSNIVTDGLGCSLVNIFTQNGSTDVEDHQIGYFQLGDSRRDLSSVNFFLKNNFYTLSSAFNLTEYGNESPLLLKTTPQVMVEDDFKPSTDLVYFLSSGIFAKLDTQAYSTFENRDVIKHRIILDEDTANGKSIRELGLFMKNPEGAKGNDRVILAAYRSLEKPIVKNTEFSVAIDWTFSIGSDVTEATPGKNFSYIVQVLSGTTDNGSLSTETDFDEFFIVNTPARYDVYPNGSPLVVGCHGYTIAGLGLSAVDTTQSTDHKIDQLLVSGVVSGLLVSKALDNGYFMVHPCLGKNATTNRAFDGIRGWNKAMSYGLWNEHVGLRHLKLAVSWVKNQHPIDDNRIYMWGFSNGGVAPITYASKLLDPTKDFMVAGVVSESPDALNLDRFFRSSPTSVAAPDGHRPRLRFWTSGMGRLRYIPESETGAGDPIEGDLWDNIKDLELSAVHPGGDHGHADQGNFDSISTSSTASFISQFYKNSAIHFQHNDFYESDPDVNIVSANLSVAKNIRHLPLVLSYGAAEQSLYMSGINVFHNWATSAARGFPGSGLDHPNYLRQIRTGDYDGHNFNHLEGINTDTGKTYLNTAWDHVSANTLSFPESGEYCIYKSQRIFNVLATPSAAEVDITDAAVYANGGAANFYFEDNTPQLSSTLSSMNNIKSFQHYGIETSPNVQEQVKRLKTNRTATLHLYPTMPSKVVANGAEYKRSNFQGGNISNENYLVGATFGDPYDFGGEFTANNDPELGYTAGNWLGGQNLRVFGNGPKTTTEQKDPYGGEEWDYLFKVAVGQNAINNARKGQVEVGSIANNTFTFSVYFQLGSVTGVDVSLSMYTFKGGNFGTGDHSTDGLWSYTTEVIDTNTINSGVAGGSQGYNNWQRVSHTATFDNGDYGERMVLILAFGDLASLDDFPIEKYIALSHAKLEEGATATTFNQGGGGGNTAPIYWEYNKGAGAVLLGNNVSKVLTWEITP